MSVCAGLLREEADFSAGDSECGPRLSVCLSAGLPLSPRIAEAPPRAFPERLGGKFCKTLWAQLDSRAKGEGGRGPGDPSHWADPSRSLPYRVTFPFKQTLARLEAGLH